MRKTIVTLAVLTAGIAGLLGSASPASAQQIDRAEVNVAGYPACENEDSNGCVWNADASGNGEGLSFIAYTDGSVRYLLDTVPTGWSRLDAGWSEAMRSEDPTRDFTPCVMQVGDTTTVVCPDGWTWGS